MDESGRSKRDADRAEPTDSTPARKEGGASEEVDEAVKVSGWSESKTRVRWRTFPTGGAMDETVRVHFEREAFSEVIAHAKDELSVEVCGVLVGRFNEDDDGIWLQVEAAIRGKTDERGGAHVKYTQETWEEIYKLKDEKHPKLDIVGWYHSHPGFGVEFSDMDKFIQQNFFGGDYMVALVTDPVNGQDAMLANRRGQVVYLERCWVEGREKKLTLGVEASKAGTSQSGGIITSAQMEKLESRLRDLRETVAQQRLFFFRMVTTVGFLIAVAVLTYMGFFIYERAFSPPERPKEIGTLAPIPIMDKDGKALGWAGIKVYWKAMAPEHQQALVENLVKQVAGSPEARQELRAMLDEMDAHEAKKQAEQGDAQEEAPEQAGDEQ